MATVRHNAFHVIGVSTRTNNAREAAPNSPIAQLWGRLFTEPILQQIPDRMDGDLVAVYTDYASDVNGDYTVVVGGRVTSIENVPAGMVHVRVPSGDYEVLISEQGPGPVVVPAAWQKVWALNLDRVYQADFELYKEADLQPENTRAHIYIGLKK